MTNIVLNNRYQIQDELGRGGMGVVFRGRDTLLDRPVAIKLVSASSLGTEGRARLLQEARAAARLNHPNIVTVYDAGQAERTDGEGPAAYVVMELVDGQSLRSLRPGTLSQILDIGRQICSALAEAHAKGIIHRDLKPENVFMTPSGLVKLVDFGLARVTGEARITQEGTLMGTLSYLAPEIIMGQPATAQSDLYALGVMLYEWTAGRPPFDANNLTAVLAQHLYAPVVPPVTFNEDVPFTVDSLIVRLLSKRPEDRPASAVEVSQALVGWQQSESLRLETGPADYAVLNRLVRGRLVGREPELAKATQLWQQALSGESQVLMVSGEPGVGKTRLVRELSAIVEISGARVLASACYAEGGMPYMPFAQILQTALSNGHHLDLPPGALAELLALAPELRLTYPNVPPNEPLEPEAEQRRLFESMVTFLSALTSQRALLLFVDDLHWADGGTLALLQHLALRLRQRPMMIVGTYREMELDETRPFRQAMLALNQANLATRVKLSRLDKTQTGELLNTLFAQEVSDAFVDNIYRETEGNPFFVEEVCRALVSSGQLTVQGGRWQQASTDKLLIPQGVQVAVQTHLAHLSEEDQGTLQLAALLGREFKYDMLCVVTDRDEDSLIALLERAQRAQLIEEVKAAPGESSHGRSPSFTFSHALIHAALLAKLSTLRRQRLQRQVALALEDAYPERLGELAPLLGRYFAEAGDSEKAIRYLLQAGEGARRLYAFEEAIEAYEQALIFLREEGAYDQAARTLMNLGLLYHNTFQFDKAQKAYEEGFALWQRRSEAPTIDVVARPFRVHFHQPRTLDPAAGGDGVSEHFIRQLFSGLVTVGLNGEILPDVAASWQLLDDGRRYLFHLRPDARWSDGRPLGAEDFVFAWKRALDPAFGRSPANLLYDICGARDFNQGRASTPDEIGVKALDPHTLSVDLDGPTSYFLQVLSRGVAMPVPKRIVQSQGSAWSDPPNLVNNGPFRIADHSPGQMMLLERNPTYHGRYEGNVAQVLVTHDPESDLLSLYESNQLDLLELHLVGRAEGDRARHAHFNEYVTGPTMTTSYIAFDVTQPPFDDVRVRRALATATDKARLANISIAGRLFPATGGVVPAGMPGHVSGVGPAYDPHQARKLLEQAGYPDGRGFPELEFLIIRQPHTESFQADLAAMWADALGIKVNWHAYWFAEFLAERETARHPIWYSGWAADYHDPDNFLRVASWRTESGWRHEGYEGLIRRARHVADSQERLALYRQAETIIAQETVIVPVFYGRRHLLLKPWVKKYPFPPAGGVHYKYVTLDPGP